MSIRSFATTAAIAATTLVAAGGVAFALGSADAPTIQSRAASVTTDAVPTTTSSPLTTSDDVPPAAPSTTAVPLEEAREIAVGAMGGGEVTKVETEVEHGRLEWKVEVVQGGVAHDVRIDAETGAVTRVDGVSAGSGPTTTTSTPAAPAPRTYDDNHRNRGGDDSRSSDDHGGRHGGDDRGGDDHGGSGRG